MAESRTTRYRAPQVGSSRSPLGLKLGASSSRRVGRTQDIGETQ
jgi:hypothetical protein